MACNVANLSSPGPFEGPEKLLEIWFAPSPAHVSKLKATEDPSRYGLRAVHRSVWEDMLDIVKCKVLSVMNGEEMDAYLLRFAFYPFAEVIVSYFSSQRIISFHISP